MRKDTMHEAEERAKAQQKDAGEHEDNGDGGSWKDNYPRTAIEEAVPVDEVTAGVDVARYDLDEVGEPPMFEVKENYPAEDGIEESAVYFHGEFAAAQVASAINQLLSGRFEEMPFDDE